MQARNAQQPPATDIPTGLTFRSIVLAVFALRASPEARSKPRPSLRSRCARCANACRLRAKQTRSSPAPTPARRISHHQRPSSQQNALRLACTAAHDLSQPSAGPGSLARPAGFPRKRSSAPRSHASRAADLSAGITLKLDSHRQAHSARCCRRLLQTAMHATTPKPIPKLVRGALHSRLRRASWLSLPLLTPSTGSPAKAHARSARAAPLAPSAQADAHLAPGAPRSRKHSATPLRL
jgi:hypothetical protein